MVPVALEVILVFILHTSDSFSFLGGFSCKIPECHFNAVMIFTINKTENDYLQIAFYANRILLMRCQVFQLHLKRSEIGTIDKTGAKLRL